MYSVIKLNVSDITTGLDISQPIRIVHADAHFVCVTIKVIR